MDQIQITIWIVYNVLLGLQIYPDNKDPMASSPWGRNWPVMENGVGDRNPLPELVNHILPPQVLAEDSVDTQIC